MLEIDRGAVTSNVKSDRLTHRVCDSLDRALQDGIGSIADRRQRKRGDELEARLKKLKETLPSGLKRLRMSLDGRRKYFAVQRRLVEQRLVVLEAERGDIVATHTWRSSRNSDAGSTPVTRRWSLARVQAT